MTVRHPRIIAAGILAGLVAGLTLTDAPAQPPIPNTQPMPANPNTEGVEVLARGPVHEAFAATVEQPKEPELAPQAPPEPVEELPPDQKPEGDNVQWIPGYWDWDEERGDFIWISGFWRVPPPNRVWVPGSWSQVANGWQWTPGFWQDTTPTQPDQPAQPQEIEYLPQPPAPIDIGPTIPAPDATSVYAPGCWVWRGRYVWRPGFWMGYRPGWVWVPSHYRWSPIGYVFVSGYWDYPLATRGVLFTPVCFTRNVLVRPGFVYTPRYVVAAPVMVGALFVRPGCGNYYFGDYFGARYARIGFTAWCGPVVPIGGMRRWHYDPLWSYYNVAHRATPAWSANVTQLYAGRYSGAVPRPPHTLVQQNQVIQQVANVTNVNNVTNNITVVNNNTTRQFNNLLVNNKDVTNHVMVAPLTTAPNLQPLSNIQPITAQARNREATAAREIRQVSLERQKAENAAAQARIKPVGGVSPTPTKPVTVKLPVSSTAVARGQVKDERKAPPPVPNHPRIEAKGPVVFPKVDPKPPAPKFTPKVDPKPPPPLGPNPPKPIPKGPANVEPKPIPKGPTKVEPKPIPKGPANVEPKPIPKGPTKVEPKGIRKVDPIGSVQDFPRRPALPVNPTPPKVAPKLPPPPPRVDPKPPVIPPKLVPQVSPTMPVKPIRPVAPPRLEPKRVPPPPPRVNPIRPVDSPRVIPQPRLPQRVLPKPPTPAVKPNPMFEPKPPARLPPPARPNRDKKR